MDAALSLLVSRLDQHRRNPFGMSCAADTPEHAQWRKRAHELAELAIDVAAGRLGPGLLPSTVDIAELQLWIENDKTFPYGSALWACLEVTRELVAHLTEAMAASVFAFGGAASAGDAVSRDIS